MAPKGKQHGSRYTLQKLKKLLQKYKNMYFTKEFFLSLLFNANRLPIIACALIIFEVMLNIAVIQRIKYTEIDWKAYMQEVEGVLNGTFDYTRLKGDTGPLVYPAGFVYVYTLLYYVTSQGQNIRLAQYIFAAIYILFLILVFRIYYKSKKVPPYALILLCCSSYRIHSIFVLRLFNDPIAMLLLYASINLFLDGRWSLGSTFFSFAVSVKMNILLFAPALLLAYLTSLGLAGTVLQLCLCAGIQLILGFPFLLSNPVAYIRGAFNLGRVFLYEWTVNWRFLPESIFTNVYFHIALLVLHLALLALFYKSALVYLRSYARLKSVVGDVKRQLTGRQEKVNMDTMSQLFLLPLFIANFVGVACSRSLHYQFYVWYYHSLPYLMWTTPFSTLVRFSLLGIIELCWNTFPSTVYSSLGLHMCHIVILYGLLRNRYTHEVKAHK